jgi:hypothetical protein
MIFFGNLAFGTNWSRRVFSENMVPNFAPEINHDSGDFGLASI